MDKRTGSLVITSVPTKRAGEQLLNYLSELFQKVPVEKLERLVETLPVTLSKSISEEKGRQIVSDLSKMGVIARFKDPLAEKDPVETKVVHEVRRESGSWRKLFQRFVPGYGE